MQSVVAFAVLTGALGDGVFRSPRASCRDVQPVQPFDLAEYVRATWYVQEQQVTSYQPEDSLQCVVATYEDEGARVPFFGGTVISVYNWDSRSEGHAPGRLCASAVDEEVPSRLGVAPCFLPTFFAGAYWVIAYGAAEDGTYDWALVSGGSPTIQYPDGCTTGQGYFHSGLWIFSRAPVLAPSKLAEAKQVLVDMGYTLSQLKKVRQEGCSYDGALIKP